MSNHDYDFDGINDALVNLCARLERADEVDSRNGRCTELTHFSLSYSKPWERYITLPDRKANLAAQIAETMWVLAGRNDIEFLSHYLPRASDFSDDGKTWRAGYGPRIRAWRPASENGPSPDSDPTDQLARVVEILRADPMSRQAVIGIWDPAVDMTEESVKDRACNDLLIFTNRRGKLDLHVTVRSNDMIWGHSGINMFEWSTLQEIVAGMLGVRVGALHFSIASLHLYEKHWSKAAKIAQIDNLAEAGPFLNSPSFVILDGSIESLDFLIDNWFVLERKIREGGEAVHLDEEIEEFPEPMMQSWLRVLQWWWSGNHAYLKPLAGTALEYATHVAVQPPSRKKPLTMDDVTKRGLELIRNGEAARVLHALQCLAANKVPELKPEQYEEFMERLNREPLHGMVTPEQAITGVCDPFEGLERSDQFVEQLTALHTEKDKAYGTSWKRRGEMLGILANIARKIDRLDASKSTSDETAIDTASDLAVYLAKYYVWLYDEASSDTPLAANQELLRVNNRMAQGSVISDSELVKHLTEQFDHMEALAKAEAGAPTRRLHCAKMLEFAYHLAYTRWHNSDQYRADNE